MKILFALVLLCCISAFGQTVNVTGSVNVGTLTQQSAGGGGGGTVTIDTSAAFHSGGTVNSLTNSITVANNANRCLYVCVGTGAASGADVVTGVSSSIDGALTEVGQVSDGAWCNAQIWRLVNPTATTHEIVGTFSHGGQAALTTISLYGVNTSDPDDTPATANGTGTAPTASVTLSTGELALGMLSTDSETGVSVTTGTERQEVENVGSDTAYSMASNTGTGSVSITWGTQNNSYALVLVPVNASP